MVMVNKVEVKSSVHGRKRLDRAMESTLPGDVHSGAWTVVPSYYAHRPAVTPSPLPSLFSTISKRWIVLLCLCQFHLQNCKSSHSPALHIGYTSRIGTGPLY
jgi:hypothetical protein